MRDENEGEKDFDVSFEIESDGIRLWNPEMSKSGVLGIRRVHFE